MDPENRKKRFFTNLFCACFFHRPLFARTKNRLAFQLFALSGFWFDGTVYSVSLEVLEIPWPKTVESKIYHGMYPRMSFYMSKISIMLTERCYVFIRVLSKLQMETRFFFAFTSAACGYKLKWSTWGKNFFKITMVEPNLRASFGLTGS